MVSVLFCVLADSELQDIQETKKSRSDVNILAAVNVESKQVLLLSTPRDYYIELPISNGKRDKLTHAGIYGVNKSMGTLEMLYNTDVKYFLQINFSGFMKIIDKCMSPAILSGYIDLLGSVAGSFETNMTA